MNVYTCKYFRIYTVCVYLCIHNKYTQYTYIYYANKNLFWMRLIAINHLTAQLFIYLFVGSWDRYFKLTEIYLHLINSENSFSAWYWSKCISLFISVCLLSFVQSAPHYLGLSENRKPISVVFPLRAGQGAAHSHNYMSQDDKIMAGVTERPRTVELMFFWGLKFGDIWGILVRGMIFFWFLFFFSLSLLSVTWWAVNKRNRGSLGKTF